MNHDKTERRIKPREMQHRFSSQTASRATPLWDLYEAINPSHFEASLIGLFFPLATQSTVADILLLFHALTLRFPGRMSPF